MVWFSRYAKFLASTILIGICFLIYYRCVTFSFLEWDDLAHIVHNPNLRDLTWSDFRGIWTSFYYLMYIPVAYSSWFALAALGGLFGGSAGHMQFDPALFHAANLLVHSANVVLVFLLGLSLVDKLETKSLAYVAAFVGALLFAIHPLQTEAVAWVSGLRDLLATFFALLSILLYLRGPKGWLLYLGSILCFGLAILAKANVVVLPLILFVLDWTHSREQSVLRLIPFICMSIAIAVFTAAHLARTICFTCRQSGLGR